MTFFHSELCTRWMLNLGDWLDGLDALERFGHHWALNLRSCLLGFAFIGCVFGSVYSPPPHTKIIA